MDRKEAVKAIEDLLQRFAKEIDDDATYLDVLDEMAMRADSAATAKREELEG